MGVSYLYTTTRNTVCRQMVIRVNPYTMRQCCSSGLNWTIISWKAKAKNTPKAMKVWFRAPKVAQIYLGEYSLTRRGIMAL